MVVVDVVVVEVIVDVVVVLVVVVKVVVEMVVVDLVVVEVVVVLVVVVEMVKVVVLVVVVVVVVIPKNCCASKIMALTILTTALMSSSLAASVVFSWAVHVTDAEVLARAVATVRISVMSLLLAAVVRSSILLMNSAHDVGTSEAALDLLLELVKPVNKVFDSEILAKAAFPLVITNRAAAAS